jgi:hypothetical protein
VQSEEKYWVFEWLDRHRISSVRAVRLLLANPVAFDDLRQAADKAISQFGKMPPLGEAVLAGRGIDLSGQLDCFAPDWRKQQAHRLFNKVWHYFDRIVIEDSIAHEMALHRDDVRVPKWLLAHLEVLLYLRQIGAEPLLVFRLKPRHARLTWPSTWSRPLFLDYYVPKIAWQGQLPRRRRLPLSPGATAQLTIG